MINRRPQGRQNQTAMRHFYALSDSYTGNHPIEPATGFANTGIVIAFRRKKDRDAWLNNTKLIKARALSRAEAIALTATEHGRKAVAIYDADAPHISQPYVASETVTLWESEYAN